MTLVNEILPAALPSPITSTPNPGTGTVTLGFTSPSRAAASNGATPVALTNVFATAVDAVLVPALTGKLRVHITGVVANSDSVTHPFTLQINGQAGAGSPFAIQTLESITVPATSVGTAFALTVDVDQGSQVQSPHTFAVGSATATIFAECSGDAGGHLSIPAQGIFLSVQEMFG